MLRSWLYLIVLVVLTLSQGKSIAREWSDTSGKYRVEAELVRIDGDVVVLKRTDGAELRVPLEKLSEADRQFLKSAGDPADKPEQPDLDPEVAKLADTSAKLLLQLADTDELESEQLIELGPQIDQTLGHQLRLLDLQFQKAEVTAEQLLNGGPLVKVGGRRSIPREQMREVYTRLGRLLVRLDNLISELQFEHQETLAEHWEAVRKAQSDYLSSLRSLRNTRRWAANQLQLVRTGRGYVAEGGRRASPQVAADYLGLLSRIATGPDLSPPELPKLDPNADEPQKQAQVMMGLRQLVEGELAGLNRAWLAEAEKAFELPDPQQRAEALITIGGWSGPRGIVLVNKGLVDKDADVRRVARAVMHNMRLSPEQLSKYLSHKDPFVRVMVLQVLTLDMLHRDLIVHVLPVLMQDKQWSVRQYAYGVFDSRQKSWSSIRDTLKVLEPVLKSNDKEVLLHALQYLDSRGISSNSAFHKARKSRVFYLKNHADQEIREFALRLSDDEELDKILLAQSPEELGGRVAPPPQNKEFYALLARLQQNPDQFDAAAMDRIAKELDPIYFLYRPEPVSKILELFEVHSDHLDEPMIKKLCVLFYQQPELVRLNDTGRMTSIFNRWYDTLD